MKVDIDGLFKSYDHNETIKYIDKLRNEIIEKEDDIKEFLKKESNNVIDNTIRIKKIYGCVEKTKKNLEDIISNYNKLVDNVKSTQVCNIEDIYKNELNEIEKDIVKNVWLKKYDKYEFLFENPFFEKKNKEAKEGLGNIINNIIINEDASLNTKDENVIIKYDYLINKKENKKKDVIVNYDCFYLNNYINNIYFDINKKIEEENYIYCINKIYRDIFISLIVLKSILKNEKIQNIYMNIFKKPNCNYYLHNFVNKYKHHFSNVILKLIHYSFYNLTFKHSCNFQTIIKSIMILLIFYNEKNTDIINFIHKNKENIKQHDINKKQMNNLFHAILNARLKLIHNFINKKKNKKFNKGNESDRNTIQKNELIHNNEYLPFNKLHIYFKKIIYVLLNTKYILLLLIDNSCCPLLHEQHIKKKNKDEHIYEKKYKKNYTDHITYEKNEICEKQFVYNQIHTDDKIHINKENQIDVVESYENNFLLYMKNEIFILQDIYNNKEDIKKSIEKNKEYFNYHINNIEDIKEKILNTNTDENFILLYKHYNQCIKNIYKYVIYLLHNYYYTNEYNIISIDFLFNEYTNIKLLYNEIKSTILLPETYFKPFIKPLQHSSIINDNYLIKINEELFNYFLFLFFNKSISIIPLFDNKPIDQWENVLIKFFKSFSYHVTTYLTYDNNSYFSIHDKIFFSFLLNAFYFYYEFYNIDLKIIYSEFSKIPKHFNNTKKYLKDKKKSHNRLSEHVLNNNNNYTKEKLFNNAFKNIIKEKIHPLLFSAYKLILFIEVKKMNTFVNVDFLYMNKNKDLSNFQELYDIFINILNNYDNIKTNTQVNDDVQGYDVLLNLLKENDNDIYMNININTNKNDINTKADDINKKADDINKKADDINKYGDEINKNSDGTQCVHVNYCNDFSNETQCVHVNYCNDFNDEEYKEFYFYVSLLRYNNKNKFNHFLDGLKNIQIYSQSNDMSNIFNNNENVHINKNNNNNNNVFNREPNFCLKDIKSIFFYIVYNIFKMCMKCFCSEYFDNLKCHLYYYLHMLLNYNMEHILCDKINSHLLNLFIFSNIFIIYIEKVMTTEQYKNIIIFIIKTILQKKIYQIYITFLQKVKDIYIIEMEKAQNKNLFNKKITELYHILLFDLYFCEQVLDKNNITNKSFYEDLIYLYKRNEMYYIKSTFYFIDIYKQTYNVYNENQNNNNKNKNNNNNKNNNKNNNISKEEHVQKQNIHPLIHKLYKSYNNFVHNQNEKNNNIMKNISFKFLIDDILVELNKLDNLNNIIYQKHIRSLVHNVIKNTYLLYYLFVQGTTLNNIINTNIEEEQNNLDIFHYNNVLKIDDHSIEEKLFTFFS
ncbi:hypothetical protein PRSY57_1461400 [Plasmodium reichenowi]|uniref:Uncharacterized protein n=1 Tax=Plasmodium reichenowi TaxID=5854 RepID=A0A151L5P3_PLARE|nr:hypothetical protein PRSY57_1461400 [Plasmodium reichenowi]KYN94271.1 hypothetical protein PRSY57_1461400 [Plasmodium reichenowi]